MKEINTSICILIFIFINSLCFGQNQKENLNIIGCWQTVKYSNAKEEVIYPKEVKMIYKFYCDGSYEMIISNSNTDQKKEQKGTYKFTKNSITLITNGGDPITDNIAFIDSFNIK
jgi:hypothetical protein